jgi:hypothetical protein
VRRQCLEVVALAYHERGGECGESGIDMDDRTSGEILDPEFEQPAVRGPDHAHERTVDQHLPQCGEGEEGREFHPFSKGPHHQRGRDHGEHALDHHEGQVGNPAHRVGDVKRGQLVRCDSLQESPLEIAEHHGDEFAVAVCEAVPERYPDHRHERQCDGPLHEDVEHILLADKSAAKQSERRDGHEHDEGCRHDDPGVVASA